MKKRFLEKPLESLNRGEVKPLAGSYLYNRMMKNAAYILSLDCDRFLVSIRRYAGIDTKGKSSYGGWEGRGGGIFYGHYLYALSKLYETMLSFEPDTAEEARERAAYIINSLKECSKNIDLKKGSDYPGKPGYLSAKPIKTLDTIEALATHDGAYSSPYLPYYGHHKVLMGLAAAYEAFGIEDALLLMRGMGDYLGSRLEALPEERREKMLNTRRTEDFFMESGGMAEVYAFLYRHTGDEIYLKYARYFDREWFLDMLKRDDNKLALGMEHVNSEIPFIKGMASYYNATKDNMYAESVLTFLDWMHAGHVFASGGISGRSAYPDYLSELYHYPNKIYSNIMDTKKHRRVGSGESCCAHNMNRICEDAFIWTGDKEYMDHWERRFINAVFSHQHAETGMFVYNLDLKQSSKKDWGTPENTFWCCYGTGIEIYSSLTTGAYFTDGESLWTGLYMPCSYEWKEKNITVTQKTDYPYSGLIEFLFKSADDCEFDFRLRAPGWLKNNPCILINGQNYSVKNIENGYISIRRVWQNADCLSLEMPFGLRTEHMPDRPEYIAVFYGPNLIVSCCDSDAVFDGDAEDFIKSMRQKDMPGAVFQNTLKITTADNAAASENITYMPLSLIKEERYHGYTKITKPCPEILVDEVIFTDGASLQSHNFSGERYRIRDNKNHTVVESELNGTLLFEMNGLPEKELYMKLAYSGDEDLYIDPKGGQPVIPLFDLQIMGDDGEWKTFCTQNLCGDFPGELFYEIYPIPTKWTRGQRLYFRIKAKYFHSVIGKIGALFDKISLFYLDC